MSQSFEHVLIKAVFCWSHKLWHQVSLGNWVCLPVSFMRFCLVCRSSWKQSPAWQRMKDFPTRFIPDGPESPLSRLSLWASGSNSCWWAKTCFKVPSVMWAAQWKQTLAGFLPPVSPLSLYLSQLWLRLRNCPSGLGYNLSPVLHPLHSC